MCVIYNCDNRCCLHFSMDFRKRVALYISITVYLLINYTYCVPSILGQISKQENKPKELQHFAFNTPIKKKQKMKIHSNNKVSLKDNIKPEDLRRKFNFPSVEFPTASPPIMPLYFRDESYNLPKSCPVPCNNKDMTNLHTRPKLSKARSKLRQKENIKTSVLQQSVKKETMDEFSSDPRYRDIGMFPDVEYPQSIKDIWRPNYWKCPQGPNKIDSKTCHIDAHSVPSLVNKSENKLLLSRKESPPVKVSNNNHGPVSTANNIVKCNLPQEESNIPSKIIPQVTDDCDKYYAATPMPYTEQNEDLIKSDLYKRIYSSIVQKTISSIKNILQAEKTTSTTENHALPYLKESDVLEDILRFSHSDFVDYDSYSLIQNTYCATTPRTTREYSYSSEEPYNVTQSWIIATTEKPAPFNYYENTVLESPISTTESYDINNILQTNYTATTLSPRGFVCDDRNLICDKNNVSFVGQTDRCDVSALDKVAVMSYNNDTDFNVMQADGSDKNATHAMHDSSLLLDDDYTTDVYPEIYENRSPFVLSSVAPQNSIDDPTWVNSGIIDPYKSTPLPDELDEYYISVV